MIAEPASAFAEPPVTAEPVVVPAELPIWSEPPKPPATPGPAIQAPPDGRGAVTFGGMLLVGGVATTGLGIGVFVDGSPGWGIAGTVVGVASIGVGIGSTLVGVHRQRRYREWQTTSRLRPPEQGSGLIGAGVATVIGSLGVLIASGVYSVSGAEPSWVPVAGFGLGGTGIALGSTLIIAGGWSNAEFTRWQKRKVSISPTASFGPRAMHFGLTGRF
jgi:hypothetical protein